MTDLPALREHGFYGVPALTDAVGKRWCVRRPRILPAKEVLGRNAACGLAEAIAAAILY